MAPQQIHTLSNRVMRLVVPGRMREWASGRKCREVLARRLGVGETAGLALAAGLAAVLTLAVVFTYLLDSVLDGEGIAAVDRPVSRWLAGHRDGWLTEVMRVITHAGDPGVLMVLAVAACAGVTWWKRSWLPIAVGVLGAGGIGLMVTAVKLVVGRSRPPLPFAAVTEDGYSFPSGHAAGITVAVLLTAWMLTCWVTRSWNARVLAWTSAVLLIGVVGFSRIYLGVHYLSDVAAGWVLGAVWAGTVALACGWWKAARGTDGNTRDGKGRVMQTPAHAGPAAPLGGGHRDEPAS
jgi:membrane-associated phospholipid phosphatase